MVSVTVSQAELLAVHELVGFVQKLQTGGLNRRGVWCEWSFIKGCALI